MFPWTPPWQRPGLVGFVVSGQPLFPGPFSAMNLSAMRDLVPPQVPKAPAPITTLPEEYLQPVRKRIKAGVAQEESEKREKLVGSWAKVVGRNLEASEIGRQVSREEGGLGLEEAVRLSLAGKATSTLATRLSAVVAYMTWSETWPPDEQSAF
eukprot:10802643-Karenia_brevis.AAC.1